MDRTDDEAEESGSAVVGGKTVIDLESTSESDSEYDDAQYGARRRKPDKGHHQAGKTYGEKGRGKILIFSPSVENGRGRGRGFGRGRGGRATHLDDRDESSGYRKTFRSKTYEKGGDYVAENFSEDGRIGRQLRLLSRETDEDVICKICQQLQEALLLPENFRYVRYNLMSIANSLLDTLRSITGTQSRQTLAQTIARLGYVSDHDFESFAKWILAAYQKEGNEKICCAMLRALTEMLKLNEGNPRLKSIDRLLLPGLQSALESADTPDLFEEALYPVLMIALKNSTTFRAYFRDTVDILVGWFVDPAQPAKVVQSASQALQTLHPFWVEDLAFSKTLISQFLEDLDAYLSEMNALVGATPTEEENLTISLKKITPVLNVFTVVGSQVCTGSESSIYPGTFLNMALLKVGQCTLSLTSLFREIDGQEYEETALSDMIQYANGCISLLVSWLNNRVTSESVKPTLELLVEEVKAADHYEYPLLMSALRLMRIVAEQHQCVLLLDVDTIQNWMKLCSRLIKTTRSREILGGTARLLRALIKVKNVPLLIEVYRRLAADLEDAFTSLRSHGASKGEIQSEIEENTLLLLSPLADLGRSTNFVGMWALDPSLLELLAAKLKTVEQIRFLSFNHPALLLGILRVLFSHAKSHSHFVANSCLLASASSGNKNLHGCTSPTSGNLSLILNLLTDLCSVLGSVSACEPCKTLLLQWIGQLLESCKPCTSQLNESDIFSRFTSSVVEFCATPYVRRLTSVETVLSAMLDMPDITLKTELSIRVAKICVQQLRDEGGNSRFLHLLGRFPPQIFHAAVEDLNCDLLSHNQLSAWIDNESLITVRSSQQFFDFILKGTYITSYEAHYSANSGGSKNKSPPASCDLPLWLAVQSALSCINTKLRSPLGRPQDTFLAIEEAIKNAASRPSDQECVTELNLAQLSRIRLLLSFYEMLEKFMYNAFDGCSVALPLAPKAIRVFFRTNQTTCQEWVNRMANACLTASVRSGRYASATRFGLNLLTCWANARRPVEPIELENVVHQLTQSLVKLRAPQSIRGLIAWMSSGNQADYFKSIDMCFLKAAAFRAESKHEEAIKIYSIKASPLPTLICYQAIDSYIAVSNWEGFLEWKDRQGDWSASPVLSHGQTAELFELFDRNMHLQWPEKPSPPVEVQWTNDQLLNEMKSGLLVAADRIRTSRSVYAAPSSSWKIVESLVTSELEFSQMTSSESLANWLPIAHALSYKNESAYQWIENTRSVLKGASCTNLPFADSSQALEWSRWLHWYAGIDRQAADIVNSLFDVDLSVVALARKEGNLQMAERHLLRSISNGQSHDLPTHLMNEALKMNLASSISARVAIKRQLEGAKLLYQKGEQDAAISVLTQCSVALSRSLQGMDNATATVLPLVAESYTQLAKWLCNSSSKNVETLRELADAGSVDDEGVLVDRLMERATLLCPSSSKAWLAWGQHQYSSCQEKFETNTLLANMLPAEDVARVTKNVDELTNIQQRLASDIVLSKKPGLLKRIITEIDNYQSSARKTFAGALKAFLKFLRLEGANSTNKRETANVTLRVLRILSREMKEIDPSLNDVLMEEIDKIHSSAWRPIIPQLFSLLQHGQPWLRAFVRKLLAHLAAESPDELVFPVAVGAAGLAWSWSSEVNDLAEGFVDNPENNGKLAAFISANDLESIYQKIIKDMEKKVPNMVKDVRLLLTELRRLVLLWDELWMSILQQVHPQMEQLVQKLQAQGQKLSKRTGIDENERKQLLNQHLRVSLKPILLVLEAVASITNVQPETPHEVWFTQRYKNTINEALDLMRTFDCSERSVNEIWQPFKNVLQQLQHINYRRSVLKLDDVSPVLKAMKDTKIPIPGVVSCTQATTLYLNAVENTVIVLPTKTKPKKFIFVGSDGKRYAYLFKGMEDLHLDQRIMQVLSLSNGLLSKSKQKYRARHYGVIPLGPRSGLIQWVEGVTPLFALYKRWLQRQAAHTAQTKGDKDNQVAAVPRPSELFYNKLTPLLEAEGLSADPRQRNQWPLEILRKVLRELMDETPKDLVARELWLGSLNAEQWWSSTTLFGRSCAVMSVIGYIIGLGDRHLDNVLVDLRCGEVVHIDYNVCFEKGRQLRVPENVPFRMTTNLQHALGAAGTGLEGTFRLSCVDVMRMMRENRELFLILLEHFIYDPLTDWKATSTSSAHEAALVPLYVVNPSLAANCSKIKRQTELDVTFELFQLRISELGPEWSESQKEMEDTTESIRSTSFDWIESQKHIESLQEEVRDLQQDRLVLFDVQADKNHVMRHPHQLQAILLPLRTAWESEKTARESLKAIVEENSKWIQLYEMAFTSLTTDQLKSWAEHVRPSSPTGPTNETGFPAIDEFLITSGQTALAQQGQMLEQQVRALKETQKNAASMVLSLLGSYTSFAAHYPSNKLEQHRTGLLCTWAKELEENLTTETCQRLASAFQDRFSLESPVLASRQQKIVDFNLSLRRLMNEATLRIHQTSLEIQNGSLESASNKLSESKETVKAHLATLPNLSVKCALLKYFGHLYNKIEKLQQEPENSFDSLLLGFGTACYVYEAISFLFTTSQKEAINTMQLVEQLHQDMQEFIFNGTTIVLPELIRLFESSDPGIILLHEELEALCIDINLSKMEASRLRLQDLLSDGNTDDDFKLTRGQMLLLGLNGLFEKIESSLIKLAYHIKSHSTLAQTCDFIEKARKRMESELPENLEDVLIAQRLVFMTSLFQSCSDWAEGFQTGEVSRELQQDSFVDKFERMAIGWTEQFLPGATLLSLALTCTCLSTDPNLCATLEDLFSVARKTINEEEDSVDKTLELLVRLEANWQNNERLRLILQRQEIDQNLIQLLQQQLTAHSWLHDTTSGLNSPSGIFVLNLRQALSVLLSQSPQLTEIHQQVTNAAAQVEQRLKWAAGANPSLSKVAREFSASTAECLRQLQEASALATSLGSVSSAILHYESFRSRTPEALASDSAYIQLLSQCQDVSLLKECGTNGRLTEAEVRLAQRINFENQNVSEDWITQTEKSIMDNITANKQKIAELQSEQVIRSEALQQLNSTMRTQLAVHHQMISDVRSILKMMAKCELEDGPVSRYLEKYRVFSELCSSASRQLAAKEYDTLKMTEINTEITKLWDILGEVYIGLEQLRGTRSDQSIKRSDQANTTALSVWRRVRLKLEGRDHSPDKPFTVEEQVDAIIEEATNQDNLALLYEGWTPWV